MYRLGIDVGGTHTDAVVLDEQLRVVARHKAATTEDVSSGILEALRAVVAQVGDDARRIGFAALGTTHCTNAVVERRRLNRVGVVRIGAPATRAIRPMTAWPADLRAAIGDQVYVVGGGHEYDGREIARLDEAALREAFARMAGRVEAVAISSVFSPVSDAHERRAAEIAREELGPDVPVSLSVEIGSVGLLERENATILNAALQRVARTAIEGFQRALEALGLEAAAFLGQNDGTLMSADYALRYPVLTIACGPTNSIRGAAFLAGVEDALVVDVGGTTSDIGVLVKGFPRESAVAVEIGGVRTNFRMPDLISIGLGGGSIVRETAAGVTVGPDSVGYRLPEEGRVFGGDVLTASDIAVAAGLARMGDPARVADLDRSLVERARATMVRMVEEALDRMKTSPRPEPVILVGGGSVLLPDKLAGASEVLRPRDFDVANAIGAALGEVSGSVDRVFSIEGQSRERVLEQAVEMARAEAVAAGADPERIQVIDAEDIPLAYLPGNATRVRVKVAGPLKALQGARSGR